LRKRKRNVFGANNSNAAGEGDENTKGSLKIWDVS